MTAFKTVTAGLGTRLEEVHAGLALLQGASAAFQTNASVHLRELTTAIQDLQLSGPHRSGRGSHRTGVASGRLGGVSANASVHLRELTSAIQDLQSSVSTLTHKLFAVHRTCPIRTASSRLTPTAASGGLSCVQWFRRRLLLPRIRGYLPRSRKLDSRSPAYLSADAGEPLHVVDMGCGRGEMLDLLREVRVSASGIDIDPEMVRYCRAKGHAVEQMDALTFLRDQPAGSVDAIFAAQVIEHFSFDQLKEFLTLCRNRLRTGGLLIAETVNPHALEAFKTFYTDLTHQRPIFPEVALVLCRLSGFEKTHIMFPLGSGDLDRDRQSRGEYAVVATAGADN